MPTQGRAPATPETPHIASCSFCAKPNTQVAALVAGPGVYICDECVALCQQVIDAGAKPAAVPRLAPWRQAIELDAVLENLPRIAKAGALVEEALAGERLRLAVRERDIDAERAVVTV